MKDRFYPLFTFLIRITYPWGLGKIIHFTLKQFNLLSNPMGYGGIILSTRLVLDRFKKLNDNLNHRKIIASIYSKLINPKILSPKLTEQIPLSSNLRFPIFVDKREKLVKYLANNQIFVSDIWYDGPISPKRFLSQTSYGGQCPNAELAAEEILNLPTHINTSEKDAERISQLINQWLKLK